MAWGDFYDPSAISASYGMSPGQIYQKAVSDWNAKPFADRAALRGWRMFQQDDGSFMLRNASDDTYSQGEQSSFYSDKGLPIGDWDSREFVDKYRIFPLLGKYNGNTDYNDATVASQGKGSLNDFLNFVGGGYGGQLVNDPILGQVYVPNNRSAFDPYRDFAHHDRGFVNNFFDSGGGVAALAGGIGALAGGAAIGGGSMFDSSLPAWAGGVETAPLAGDILSGGSAITNLYGGTSLADLGLSGLNLASGSSWMPSSVSDWITKQITSPSNAFKLANYLSGSGGGTGGKNMTTQSTQSTDSIWNDILGLGAKSIPSLLAWNYVQNLPKPDISQYQSLINRAGDMSGPLGQYDINTGTGRDALTSSLASRGVSGSSFGDQALTTYNTQRDIGRGALGYSGLGTQGQLLNSMNSNIINNNKNSTDFLGRLLGGVGGAFGTGADGNKTATDYLTSLAKKAFPGVFGGSDEDYMKALSFIPNSTTGVDMTGFADNDYLNNLFSYSTTPLNFTNPLNDGLTLGTYGIGTYNPLSNWLTDGVDNGMSTLSNLWGW